MEAAPEKSAYLDGHIKTILQVTQKTDVWSLGCVLSEAATFVVLGREGVLQYERVRRVALERSRNTWSDTFHNGDNVLPEIGTWHQYLRSASRRTDSFTPAILDLVDEYMLVSPENYRLGSNEIFSNLQNILERPASQAQAVPKEIEEILEDIDLDEELRYEQSIGIKRVDSDDLRRKLPDQVYVDNKNPSQTKKILPTVQRSLHRTTPPSTIATYGIRAQSSVFSPSTSALLRINTTSTISPKPAARTYQHDAQSRSSEKHPVMTVWAVERELEENGKKRELPSLKKVSSFKFRRQPTSIREDQKMWKDKKDPLEGFLHGRDIVSVMSTLETSS